MVTLVVIIALVACLVASVYISRGVRLIEYISNRGRSSHSQILYTLLGSLVGGWMFFGLCAVGYEAGIAGYIIGVGYCVGLLILGRKIPHIKKAMEAENCDTLDDLVGARYGRAVHFSVTSINLLLFLAILAAQFIALSAFLEIFADIESNLSLYVGVIVVLVYTVLAGFKGVLLTDRWQFYVLAISAVAVFAFLTANADWEAVSTLDPKYFNGTGYGVAFLIGVLVFFPASLLVRTDLWQRIASAKDALKAQRAFYFSAPILLLFYVILTSIGIYGRAALGDGVQPDVSGFIHFLNILSAFSTNGHPIMATVFLSVMSLGVFAALLSTADTNLNVISVAISKLIKPQEWHRFESEISEKITGPRPVIERRLLTATRLVAVVLGILSVLVATVIPDIVNLIVAGATSVLVFLPAVYMTVFKNTRKTTAALISIVLGFAVLLFLLPKMPKSAFVYASLVAALIYFAVAPFVHDFRE